jgi:cell division protein FtsQ
MKHRRRLLTRGLAGLLLVVVLVGGGWLWVRDSSLAKVRTVTITGTTTSEQDQVRSALENAARGMTTLNVREEALRGAVASYPSVAGLDVRTDFPHGLAIEVREHRQVAALIAGDRRIPVSGDGVVLTGVRADADLPDVKVKTAPAERVEDRRTRAAIAVAAAAPAPLLERTERIGWGSRGLTAILSNGPPLHFGDPADAARKWAAAARVLREETAAGATYLDLRVTGRVAAGGVGPVPQEGAEVVPQP